MTREERIEKLRHLITCMKCEVSGKSCDNNCPTQYNAGNMGEIIENLEEIAKALEQEPCEDAISRDELLKAINTWDKFGYTETGCFVREPKNDCVKYIHYDDVIKCIKGMPSVKPQPKTGHWIEIAQYSDGKHKIECSECGDYIFSKGHANSAYTKQNYKYCPNCGTKMER